MAIDTTKEDQIVGIRINYVTKRGEPEDEKLSCGDALSTLGLLGSYAYNQVDPWNRFKEVDTILEAEFLLVHKDYRGMNISVLMMELTFDYMRKEKIPLFYLWATSAFARNIVEKLGFELIHEIKYEDFKVDGKQVFFPEKIHTASAAYIKWVN